MKQKGFAPILILVGILVLGLIAGGAYYFGKPQTPKPSSSPVTTSQTPKPSSTPSTISDETANWKTYTNTEGKYSLNYPKNWYFKTYEQQTQKAQAIFQNKPFSSQENNATTKDGFVFGEIKIMTAEAMRGLEWANISEVEFYNPNSGFWLKGNGIGGGPGFTQETPVEITLDDKRAIMQSTRPDKAYEFVYPEQITNYYYVYLGNSAKEILIISFTYDQKIVEAKDNIDKINQILATFKFTQ